MLTGAARWLIGPMEPMRGVFSGGTNELTDRFGKHYLRRRLRVALGDKRKSKSSGFQCGRVTHEGFRHGPHHLAGAPSRQDDVPTPLFCMMLISQGS